jgi:hypothetical protein
MFWCCARLGSAYLFRMGSAVGVMVFWSRVITALQQQQQQEVGSASGLIMLDSRTCCTRLKSIANI